MPVKLDRVTNCAGKAMYLPDLPMPELNKNSMLYWFPKLDGLDIPVPRTKCVPAEVYAVREIAEEIGWPVFLRTDLCSGKHDWDKSCFVPDARELAMHITNVCAANERWEMLGIKYECLVVREFLNLETYFTAFVGNMPINKERRYFVRGGEVVCWHPYWPETAFDRHPARQAHDPRWRELLRRMQDADTQADGLLNDYALRVAKQFDGFWSVDFAKAKDGTWYLLDMALGDNSYHMPHGEEAYVETGR